MMKHFTPNLFVEHDAIAWEIIDDKIRRKILNYDDSMMMVIVEFKSGGCGSLHQHSNVQMSYVASGIFEIEIGQEIKRLKAGDVFYIPSNQMHGATCIQEGCLIDVFTPLREDFLTT